MQHQEYEEIAGNYRFENASAVRLIKSIRNDGTFPGKRSGEVLVRKGTVGFVRQAGVFLQEHNIYEIHFIDDDLIVGCREKELQDAELPWVESLFETRDRVMLAVPLEIKGETLVDTDQVGEVVEVNSSNPDKIVCQVHFGERYFNIPEKLLVMAPELDNQPDYEFNQTQKMMMGLLPTAQS
ncbi:NifZ family protein [Magnetococcus marinus MC-1]|uniref:NifZ family protein n=1 Tax=Magnetococcus marinus (strain ATCC BAA-1437 / JCM 17883 / MC-1) TaxID=156889 RepID=A0L6V7_MAGMM|nr:nitrogen fixation protein NifZ [Magnetococcus marinus]ABK43700.1 NifZ family protein [Magnetococcus marinus MC-1]